MKITLGAKELENIVGAWATDRYDAGVPSVKIVKKRDSIDVIIDYADAKESETLCNNACNDVCTEDSEETQA